ncbi:MAG: hypothetical protein OHK0039_47010 [Bacteroidia bacterium]
MGAAGGDSRRGDEDDAAGGRLAEFADIGKGAETKRALLNLAEVAHLDDQEDRSSVVIFAGRVHCEGRLAPDALEGADVVAAAVGERQGRTLLVLHQAQHHHLDPPVAAVVAHEVFGILVVPDRLPSAIERSIAVEIDLVGDLPLILEMFPNGFINDMVLFHMQPGTLMSRFFHPVPSHKGF